MKYSTAIVTFAAVASAQLPDPNDFFPECSIDCLADARAEATDCNGDLVCNCIPENKMAVTSAAIDCLTNECALDDLLTLEQIGEDFCNAVEEATSKPVASTDPEPKPVTTDVPEVTEPATTEEPEVTEPATTEEPEVTEPATTEEPEVTEAPETDAPEPTETEEEECPTETEETHSPTGTGHFPSTNGTDGGSGSGSGTDEGSEQVANGAGALAPATMVAAFLAVVVAAL